MTLAENISEKNGGLSRVCVACVVHSWTTWEEVLKQSYGELEKCALQGNLDQMLVWYRCEIFKNK